MYAFVGIKGMAKMSSSSGGVPTPADALEIMEPALVRWLYARRKPAQSFNVAFDGEVHRIYDEWDSLSPQGRRRYGAGRRPGGARPRHVHGGGAAADHAAAAALPHARLGHRHHAGRRRADAADPVRPRPRRPVGSLDELRPRLSCAAALGRHADARRRTAPTCAPSRTASCSTALDEQAARVAAAARRGPARPLVPGRAHRASSTPCRRSRPACPRRPRPRRRS